jgi:hypothetical protein
MDVNRLGGHRGVAGRGGCALQGKGAAARGPRGDYLKVAGLQVGAPVEIAPGLVRAVAASLETAPPDGYR